MGMKRALLLSLAGLAACVTRSSPDNVYRANATATLTSLQCSHTAVQGLGYQVTGQIGGSAGTVRAERQMEDGTQRWRGYITLSVPGGEDGLMYVTAERVSDGRITGTTAGPRPLPPAAPVPTARRMGPERVSPGPVASDARRVLRRCAIGAIEEGA